MTEPAGDLSTRLLDQRIERAVRACLDRGGEGGNGGGGVEQRWARLEQGVSDLRTGLTRIEAKIDQLPNAADFFELKGRVSQLPTIRQLIWPLMAFVATPLGMSFVLRRFALPRG